jgi:hypothetical protein
MVFRRAEWILPPACKRGRLHRRGCSHRLSRRNPDREKAGRGARHIIRVRRLDSFLDPGRETDHRPFKSLARQARHPAQWRSLQADRDRPPADARRNRKATANRILTKAALNRAFHTDRVPTDMAWRKVKHSRASTRPWCAIENARGRPPTTEAHLRTFAKAGTISPYAVPELWRGDALHHQSRVGIHPGVRFAAKPLNRAV